MKVILFGATGMVGQGVLRECLLDDDVTEVLSIGRRPTGKTHPKLRELLHEDFLDFTPVADQLTGYDACFFCLGISSAGMSEPDYRRVTFDMPLAAARVLVDRNPSMTFVYVSGAGADATEQGKTMWARVKGAAENALQKLPFKGVYVVRPAAVRPMNGERSQVFWYNVLYVVIGPLLWFFGWALPKYVTTTEQIGRAMLQIVRGGAPLTVLESTEIRQLAGPS